MKLPRPTCAGQWIERPFVLLLVWMIRGYQIVLSPLLPPACRFYPSCSQYALEALAKRRLFVALGLTAWRLLRCNPLCKGGYDPVDSDHGECGRGKN